MATDPAPLSFTPPPRRSHAAWWIAGIAFALGLVAMYAARPYLERWRTQANAAMSPTTAPPQPVQQPVGPAAPATLEGLAAREAVLDDQLRGVEQRLAAVDVASRSAAGNAARGEALLLAFAARRTLDRGLALGYLEAELTTRFGLAEPRAVAFVQQASRQPMTLEDLRFALDAIAPRLTSGSASDGVWRSIRNELATLVVLRRAATPSPLPADRLRRARRMLDAGNVEGALAEVERMPGAAAAASWTDAARRYVLGRRALDRLELAAIAGRAALPVAPAPAPVSLAPPPVVPTINPAGETPVG